MTVFYFTVSHRGSISELALAEHGIPFESHIYSYGGHGFSTAEDWVINNSRSARVPDWVESSVGWLKETLGTLTMKGFSEPNIAVSKNGNTAPVLSVMCTLNHLRKQSGEAQAVLKPLFDGMQAVADARGYTMEGLMAAIGNNTLRELMEMVQVDGETIQEIDKALHSMVNKIG